MERRWSSGSHDDRYRVRERQPSRSHRRSRSPHRRSPPRRSRSRHRRRRRRSRSWDSPLDDRHHRRRHREPRHRQRSSSSVYDDRRSPYEFRRNDSWYESEDRYSRRRRGRSPRRRKKRRRENHPRRRRRSPSVSASPPPVARRVVRAGVVSDDEGEAAQPSSKKKQSSSTSSRDDTVGHFRGDKGTVVADRYEIVRDVGLGTFGRVVECLDSRRRARKAGSNKKGESDYVAIKIVRDVQRYYDSAVIEASIVEEVNRRGGRGISHCAIMHDAFTWNSHYCMVFESLGPSLYDFLKKRNYCGFPMICVRDFARQLLEALEFLHSAGLIHTDLKPENILLISHGEVPYKWHGKTYRIPESTKVKVIDFGGATYDNEKKSSVVNTRQYRAPEVILELGWSMPSDLWSAGCILAELYLGELLFATHDNHEHLALIEKVVAPFPRRILDRAKNSKLVQETFGENGRHRLERVLPRESASYVSKMRPLDAIIRPEDRRFLDLLRMLLVINPDERATAQACVRHRL